MISHVIAHEIKTTVSLMVNIKYLDIIRSRHLGDGAVERYKGSKKGIVDLCVLFYWRVVRDVKE